MEIQKVQGNFPNKERKVYRQVGRDCIMDKSTARCKGNRIVLEQNMRTERT